MTGCVYVLVAQSCPTLCSPMDCSLPGSSVHGILQARILELVAIPSSRGSSPQGSNAGLLHCRWILYHLSHPGSPNDRLSMKTLSIVMYFPQQTLSGAGLCVPDSYHPPASSLEGQVSATPSSPMLNGR